MLFKERIYLSNCDSVRHLNAEEIRKRFLIALVFGNGVVLSPNILSDNDGIYEILREKSVVKFLNEEGSNFLMVRGINIAGIKSVHDYFDRLPGNYKVSYFKGKEKQKLSSSELKELKRRLEMIDGVLSSLSIDYRDAPIELGSLTREIHERLKKETAIGSLSVYFDGDRAKYQEFLHETKRLVSRSEWYEYVAQYWRGEKERASAIITELIDPAYNSLFVEKREVFVQDNIRYLENIPTRILAGGVLVKSLRRELELLEYPLKAFEIVTTYGMNDLVQLVTDEALGYLEEKFEEKGVEFLSRKNWFGLYPMLRKKMGLEIKS